MSDAEPSRRRSWDRPQIPLDWVAGLDEVAAGSPLPDPALDDRRSLEEVRGEDAAPAQPSWPSQLYILSHLLFFSLLGTMARLGLSSLTTYRGAPVIFSSLWANLGGSLLMGFLVEVRQRHLGRFAPLASGPLTPMPFYIGLTTGFCGSFTSFSALIRDAFLALSNDLASPSAPNGGYAFMALLAVLITTIGLSISGLLLGAHLAAASDKILPRMPPKLVARLLDPLAVILGWSGWIVVLLLVVLRSSHPWFPNYSFSLLLAPPGCFARFYLALGLNRRIAAFPLGTFVANLVGTAILALSWDLLHAPVGGFIGCQVLQGLENGFCGCLTTVSTWVTELAALRRLHAYLYGFVSIFASLALFVVIVGPLRWTRGFAHAVC